ncbi:MAG: Asp-tRNA(Asn)/Glu-tRNA(Gln) amidotransferase subunit GatA [Candidatus Nomurabacteria bacterium]|jgi:aspartyl-tRNA(Asn)/glutamyl-tRNA(Gln) amidotransferase subunit A|nr:Asp-tRNA(Asn)/Glu-tRNA(Gln) amidotransferase subunit GatA [Candidatus Nomurabacteria bacterium]
MSEIKKIVDKIRTGQTMAVAEVMAAVERAKNIADTNAILEITEEYAIKRAEQVDKDIADGKIGRLAGVPFVAKDNFLTFGSKTTAASKILQNFQAPLQATVIEKLEAEGAICIGKANLDSFAHGGSTENSAFGVTHNAVDSDRVAGGSSGGSAVVVARGVVPFALGTDTGGSIRQPASFNGVVGLKSSYGLISRFGVVAMASSTDVVGPIARTVEDAEIVTEIMAGKDGKDMTVWADGYRKADGKKPKCIGVIKEFMGDGVYADVKAAVKQQVENLTKEGYIVREVSLPMVKYAISIYYIVVPAELSSNLARYDGIRYGQRSQDAKTLAEIYGLSRDEGFVDENKRRIMIGAFVLSSGFFDAYYLQAEKARTLLIADFDKAFADVDFLIGPVAPTPAFKIGEKSHDPIQMYLSDIMTVPASLAGLPAISVPVATTKNKLPIGLQIIAPYKKDSEMLAFAKTIKEEKK